MIERSEAKRSVLFNRALCRSICDGQLLKSSGIVQSGVIGIGMDRERGERSLRNLEQARGECQDRERWKLFCRGHPLVGAPRSRRRGGRIQLLAIDYTDY